MKRALAYVVPLAALVLGLVATPRGVALDHWLVERAVALDRESSALHASMQFGTELGQNTAILAGLLVPAAFGGEVARVTVRIAALSLGATRFATTALKWITNRERPSGRRGSWTCFIPSRCRHRAVG